MNSTRKLLLTDDGADRNGTFKRNFNVPNTIIEDNEGEDYEYDDGAYSQHSAVKLKSPLTKQDYTAYQVNSMSKPGGNNNLG